jgi:hypothetical protein
MEHALTAVRQDLASLKSGIGVEHQFPQLYSQVGVGEVTIVVVQRDADVLVVVVGLRVEDVDRELVVLDPGGDELVGLEDDEVEVDKDEEDVEGVGVELEETDDDDVVLELVDDKLVEDEDDVEVVDVELEEVDDEDEGGPPLHGSVDSISFATYRFNSAGPPQNSVESPLHSWLHCASSTCVVPLPRTTPHQHS